MTVNLPDPIGPFRQMQSTAQRAQTLATNLRAVAANVSDVRTWAEESSGDWAGDTKEAHDHARTRFSGRTAGAEAALLNAVVAADRFEDRLRRLQTDRSLLDADRVDLNNQIAEIKELIGQAFNEHDLILLRARATRLRGTAQRLVEDIGSWVIRLDTAESDFIRALARVDAVSEGRQVAGEPGRPDVAALTGRLGEISDDPVAVVAWWRQLSRLEKQALMLAHPQLIGNLDGIPVRDRDEANRTALYADLDRLKERAADDQLTGEEEEILRNAEGLRDKLDDLRDQVDPWTGDHLVNVLVYKPGDHSGDGGIALSQGDPDTADHVAVYVPGTTSEGGNVSGFDQVQDLYDQMTSEDRGSVATVLWLDYDAPSIDGLGPGELYDIANVVVPVESYQGGEDLADFFAGLRATDEGDPAHLTGVAHSYGATTLSYALLDGAPVDEGVLLGSPGAPTPTAGLLTDADVYVGAADYDPVSLLGLGSRGGMGTLGFDPAQDSFGADRFQVDPGSYRIQDLIANHSTYFQGESLDNIGTISTGQEPTYDHGRTPVGPGSYQTLTEVIAGSTTASGGEWLWDHGGSQTVDTLKDVGGFLAKHGPAGGFL